MYFWRPDSRIFGENTWHFLKIWKFPEIHVIFSKIRKIWPASPEKTAFDKEIGFYFFGKSLAGQEIHAILFLIFIPQDNSQKTAFDKGFLFLFSIFQENAQKNCFWQRNLYFSFSFFILPGGSPEKTAFDKESDFHFLEIPGRAEIWTSATPGVNFRVFAKSIFV